MKFHIFIILQIYKMVLQSTYKCNFAQNYIISWVGAIYLGCRKTIGFYWILPVQLHKLSN